MRSRGLLNQGYRGSRYSFGYPACPDLADQKQLLALLGAKETLSEEDQLDTEQSTSAIVLSRYEAESKPGKLESKLHQDWILARSLKEISWLDELALGDEPGNFSAHEPEIQSLTGK